MTALKGINIGGWLVLERWITPTLFQGTAATTERELTAEKGGRARIRQHQETFITEQDIAWIASQKFQLLRVPVGYWIFGDDPDFVGSIDRLDWLVRVAKKYGLQVLIDLHGAPGAHNHQHHNGGAVRVANWLTDTESQEKTIAALEAIARRYRTSKTVWGIELLNEPLGGRFGVRLAWFYRRAYRAVVKVARPGTHIVFSDAYRPWLLLNTFGWFRQREFPVVMDMHVYYVFGARNKRRNLAQHLGMVRRSKWRLKIMAIFQPVMVGEWSAALPYGVSIERAAEYANLQIAAYESTVAWCYWTYKTGGSGHWDYRKSFGD